MAESRHVKRFRTIFSILQLLLLVPGLFLLVLTLTLYSIDTPYQQIISRHTYFFSAYIIVPVSILMIPATFFGVLVSIRHKVPAILSTVYLAVLCLLFVGQMTGSCLGFLNYSTLRNLIGRNFQSSILDYNTSNLTRNSIDSTQLDLGCCGGGNYTDWDAFITENSYPTSCCQANNANSTCTIPHNTSSTLATISNKTILFVNEIACADAIARSVIGQTYAIGYIGLLVLLVPGILIVVTFCLVNINLSLN